MPLLVIAFVVVPIVELAVIGSVSDRLGLPLTLVLLLVDSLVGAVLVRREGRRAWTRFREALANGRWPGDEVAQGALVLIGGALLLTPGFVTDGVGLAFVIPPTRAILSRVIRARITPGPVRVFGDAFGGAGQRTEDPRAGDPRAADPRRRPGPDVVDVEVVSVERDEDGDDPQGELDRPQR